MKQWIIAIVLTLFTVGINTCLAETKTGQQFVKTAEPRQLQKLALNNASLEQLIEVPGVGPAKAQAILDYIGEHGPIKDSQQLTKVKGIGEKLAAKISEYVSFD